MVAEFYMQPGVSSPRYRKLVAFCRRSGILLLADLTERTWGERPWEVGSKYKDGRKERAVLTNLTQVLSDCEQGFIGFAHEIGHHIFPLPAGKKKRLYERFVRREPVGLLQILVEIFAWVVGYAVILAVKESFPITSYAKYAAECVGTYVKYYFRR